MGNINELIYKVNNNLRNNTEIEKSDIKQLLNIAIEMEKQLHKNAVSKRRGQLKCNHEPKSYVKKHTSCKKCGNILQMKP